MALTSTLFTGLSGLDVNQTRLNVVGNNIANVNTVAFKSSRALFKPQFYVTDEGGTPPSSEFGGTNPSQRGLGAVVASIQKDFTAGPIEPTGRPTDLAVDGTGFFVVQGDEQRFTRDGSFSLNATNQLVSTSGEYVQGYAADSDGGIIAGQLTDIEIPLGTTASARPTENNSLEGNFNSSGPIAAGASILTSQLLTTSGGTLPTTATAVTDLRSTGSAVPLFNTGDVVTLTGEKGGRSLPASTLTVGAGTTVAELSTFFQNALGIDSSVATAGAPVPGIAFETDATDLNSGRLVVAGNVGLQNALALSGASITTSAGAAPLAFIEGSNAAGFTSDPVGESVHTSFVAYDSLGTPVSVDLTAVLESRADTGNTWRFYVESPDDAGDSLSLGSGTLTFGTDGKLLSTTGTTLTIDRSGSGAISPLTMNLNLEKVTSLTAQNSELAMTDQDGSPLGTLQSFSIGDDGTITGAYSNGRTSTIGQIAMATFDNPMGLVDGGGSMFTAGPNSGVPVISTPLALGAGAVRSGSLELSNVDISEQFINMIISSTGFSASSRVITTSDQLLTELLNSAR
ncbi:MAG: flagellar hook-basal body complex protein [Burkholderiales bacterium]|nr:flagellar hook-basal body complex protein [Phycisphaerae bacterium]